MMKKKQGGESNIVAMDVGSGSIRAMMGRFVEAGQLEILGYASVPSDGCVERGWVCDSARAATKIGEVLRILANKVMVDDILSVFVCAGGYKTQIVGVASQVKDLGRVMPISQNEIDSVLAECEKTLEAKNDGIGIVELIPFGVKVDDKHYELSDAMNMQVRAFQLESFVFYTERGRKIEFEKCFQQSVKRVEHRFYRSDVLLSLYADDEALREGCGILDIGTQTTTLAIFKSPDYLFTKTFPHGGRHITNLIAQQGISMTLAEELKCKYGYAAQDYVVKDFRMQMPGIPEIGGNLLISSKELAALISSKLGEILDPIITDLNAYSSLIRRLYITGGGSMLRGLDRYIQERTSIRVQYGSHNGRLSDQTDATYFEPRFASLIGTLLVAQSYKKEHETKVQKKGWWLFRTLKDGYDKTIFDLFTNPYE